VSAFIWHVHVNPQQPNILNVNAIQTPTPWPTNVTTCAAPNGFVWNVSPTPNCGFSSSSAAWEGGFDFVLTVSDNSTPKQTQTVWVSVDLYHPSRSCSARVLPQMEVCSGVVGIQTLAGFGDDHKASGIASCSTGGRTALMSAQLRQGGTPPIQIVSTQTAIACQAGNRISTTVVQGTAIVANQATGLMYSYKVMFLRVNAVKQQFIKLIGSQIVGLSYTNGSVWVTGWFPTNKLFVAVPAVFNLESNYLTEVAGSPLMATFGPDFSSVGQITVCPNGVMYANAVYQGRDVVASATLPASSYAITYLSDTTTGGNVMLAEWGPCS
jgi:hypothetical protein